MLRLPFVAGGLLMSLLILSGPAEAGLLAYQPETVELTIPAGTGQQVPIKVGVSAPKGSSYMLWFLDSVSNGNLPAAWLSVSPTRTFLFGASPGSATVTVAVPDGTPSGTYSGVALARAMSSHEIPPAGTGIRFTVTVPSSCSGVPRIAIDSLAPAVVWPPDRSMTQVVVTGTVTAPEGCGIAEAGYAVEDEYQLLSSMGTVRVASDGSFTLVVPVEAMRYGQDKDGRHYRVTLFARDEAGVASSEPQEIVVPHDRRN